MNWQKIKDQWNWKDIVSVCYLILYPVFTFYLMENFTHNPFTQVRARAQIFNIILFELAAAILVLVIGRVRVSLLVLGMVSCLFGLSNAYVIRFRSNPIVPWDLFSVRTAAAVADQYDFTPDVRMVTVVLFYLILFVLLCRVKVTLRFAAFWKRLILAAAFTAAFVSFCGVLQREDFQTKHWIYNKRFTPAYMTNVDGMALAFVMNLPYLFVEKPKGYSAQEAKELLLSYQKTAEPSDAGEGVSGKKTEELPNIIVMMNESFADLSVLGAFDTNEDYMPFLHSLEEGAQNTVTGMLNVSVCGGNTPNTEFEFLTGNTMAFLPQGSIPYQQYLKNEMPSLASHLKSLGYETVAMHPYQSYGWERDRVYPLLGFDRSLFLRDFAKKQKVRQYISDHACVEKIIEIYEKKKQSKPLFLFNVTMQNHGGYQNTYPNFTPDITAEGIERDSVSHYLSLIKLSDAALKEMIDYFSQKEEKTVVVFFGDHQPNDSVAAPLLARHNMKWNELDSEQIKLRYQVPYVIWANYEIEAETDADISANYLGAEVLKRAGVPLYDYQKFLLQLEESYPVLSAVRMQKKDGSETELNNEQDGLSEYRKLQYYQIFEK